MSASGAPTEAGKVHERMEALEASLRALQEDVAALRRTLEDRRAPEGKRAEVEEAPAPVPAPAAPGAPPRAAETVAEPVSEGAASPFRKPEASAWRGLDLEALIGGRWLNRVGILTLLFAAAFFLHYAFENGWVGPTGRILIGLVGGVALGLLGEWLARRDMRYFAEGMTALGAGVVYLSGYAAWGFYALVPQPAAFGFLAFVTAAVIGLSVRRDSQRLAALALAAGYLAPALLSTGEDAQVVLFSYLLLLSASLLALALLRGFHLLAPAALVATVLYFVRWYVEFFEPDRLLSTAFFGTLLYLVYVALPLACGRRARRLRPSEIVVLALATGSFVMLLQRLLYGEHRWLLTGAVLTLAALCFALSRALGNWSAEGRRGRQLQVLFAVQAVALATIAFPIRLEGDWITVAWTAEASALAIAGARLPSLWMRIFSAGLFAVVLSMAPQTLFERADQLLFVNLRFLTLGGAATGLAAAGLLVLRMFRKRKLMERTEARLWTAGLIIANIVALVAVSLETWDLVGDLVRGLDLDLDLHLAAQVALSALWLLWACVLVGAGIRRDAPGLRWQGLALLFVVVGKTFVLDLSFLEQGYRVLSFLIVGALLVAVSFLYQRRRR